MPDARWNDPREYDHRDRGDGRFRVYGERDRDDHDPRDSLIHDLDLPRGEERELVVERTKRAVDDQEDPKVSTKSRRKPTQPETVEVSGCVSQPH
jgi:hypothetical protein